MRRIFASSNFGHQNPLEIQVDILLAVLAQNCRQSSYQSIGPTLLDGFLALSRLQSEVKSPDHFDYFLQTHQSFEIFGSVAPAVVLGSGLIVLPGLLAGQI